MIHSHLRNCVIHYNKVPNDFQPYRKYARTRENNPHFAEQDQNLLEINRCAFLFFGIHLEIVVGIGDIKRITPFKFGG